MVVVLGDSIEVSGIHPTRKLWLARSMSRILESRPDQKLSFRPEEVLLCEACIRRRRPVPASWLP